MPEPFFSRSHALASTARDPAPEWTLADLLAVLIYRRSWIIACLACFTAMAFLDWALSTPRYRATAQIEVQAKSQGAFGLENVTADQSSSELSDSFEANLNIQTELGILQSNALALDVIRRTGLETTPDYFGTRPARLPWLSLHTNWHQPIEPLSTPLADAPNRRYEVLRTFSRFRKVSTVAGTRLITISYTDRDPARAAQVANALVQSLADYSFQSRSSAAAQSASWLSTQLAELKKQTEALDERAAMLDRQAGSLGDDDAHNIVLARLDELNSALSTAESNRIVREAIWRAVQSGDPEVISGLGGNPAAGTNTQNSFALLQALRAEESTTKAQIAESANRYGENWPAVAEQRARLATIERSIQDEVRRLGERARSDYEVAVQAENSARAAFSQQKAVASQATGSTLALRLARQEAGESRALYTSLLGRLQQTGVLQGLHSGNFTVVAPALVPPPEHPTSPNLPLLAAASLSAGLVLGSGAALLRELTDDSIHSAADLESLLDAPVFAALPPEPSRPWYVRILPVRHASSFALEAAAASDCALPAPVSPRLEALHRLRASLLISRSESAPQIILLTPASPGAQANTPRRAAATCQERARPSVALDLATILAQHGSPTLYVDANLRTAPVAGDGPVEPGLSDWLTSQEIPAAANRTGLSPLLSVIPSGPQPPCPSELIASRRMAALLSRWRGEYFHIVIDGPSAAYADALVLAQQSDAVLVSLTCGQSEKLAVLSAFHAFSRQVSDRAILGLVLDGVPHAHA